MELDCGCIKGQPLCTKASTDHEILPILYLDHGRRLITISWPEGQTTAMAHLAVPDIESPLACSNSQPPATMTSRKPTRNNAKHLVALCN